jgi:hypothetical protein
MKTYREPLSITSSYQGVNVHESLWTKFINWCAAQEERRYFWLGLAIGGHGCVFTILTVLAIMLAGNPIILWPFALGAMAACLIVNLAAMPTKITIPVFFASLLIDAAIIGICVAHGLSFSNIY